MEDRLEMIFRLQKSLDEDIMQRRKLEFPYAHRSGLDAERSG